ncbi:tRNA(Glu)-specific nuclease WapA precursor [Gimesia alba]|uniref:tRNA(Glu)-specific nuclease WapA n=1 Tax=Gimesia alba TaxID=2527973 RepID=A0A517RJI1_9PLAN|nr:RHS repeat-associated core domain-containing protein [Gimesia alba]QDT44037.1 tRNA(Glu)-specific nuclease WapA precursor [Gimesia alba]
MNGVPETPQTLIFLADGHGSTRVLADAAGAIASISGVEQLFFYDAYGNLLNMQATQAATSYLYSGEQFDPKIGQQYLRARYYDATTGRFNRLDPFAGNTNDPQSLHKYLYTHADPINGTDPSGLSNLPSALGGLSIGSTLGSFISAAVTQVLINVATSAAVYLGEVYKQKIRPIPRNKLGIDQGYAELARAVYSQDTKGARPVWKRKARFSDDASGYKAALYENKDTRELVLAFAGTEELNPIQWPLLGIDMVTNIAYGLFNSSLQYQRAVDDSWDVIRKFPGRKLRFVGHSLGGGLATVASLSYNIKATTFNAAGVHPVGNLIIGRGQLFPAPNPVFEWFFNPGPKADKFVDAYRVRGEVLSTLQDLPPAYANAWQFGRAFYGIAGAGALAILMPNSAGKAYWLPSRYYIDPFSRHTIGTVLDSFDIVLK